MRVAAIQCTAVAERERNLLVAGDLVAAAARGGAELVVLPEHFACYGDPARLRASAEPIDGSVARWGSATAARHGIWLVVGSFVEAMPTDLHVHDRQVPAHHLGGTRRHNTSCLCGPDGSVAAAYRKVHLFDVDVPGAVNRESDAVAPGDRVVVASISGQDGRPLPLGLSICYDLRFPELYRLLMLQGALVVAVPSAFSVPTGRAHWEVLLRARAIENQVFLIAANQCGRAADGVEVYGHSMIVDPWGEVLAELPDGEGIVTADLDLAAQQEIRSRLPSLTHRRPAVYGEVALSPRPSADRTLAPHQARAGTVTVEHGGTW